MICQSARIQISCMTKTELKNEMLIKHYFATDENHKLGS